MDLTELAHFLERANKQTYANKSAPKAASLRPSSEDYHFEEGGLAYHDTYFGSRDFIGEEVIYRDGKPVWGTNYYGFVLKAGVLEKEVYGFLRQALMQPNSETIPVRGPSRYATLSWEYANTVDGGLDRFVGIETISLKGEDVYRCFYHGGLVQ